MWERWSVLSLDFTSSRLLGKTIQSWTIFGLDKSCSHGREFKKMAKRLNETYDLNITKYLDISQYIRREGTPTISYWLAQWF